MNESTRVLKAFTVGVLFLIPVLVYQAYHFGYQQSMIDNPPNTIYQTRTEYVYFNETRYVHVDGIPPLALTVDVFDLNATEYTYFWDASFPNVTHSIYANRSYFCLVVVITTDDVFLVDDWIIQANLTLPHDGWITWHGIEVFVEGVIWQTGATADKVQAYALPEQKQQLSYTSERAALWCTLIGYGTETHFSDYGTWLGKLSFIVIPKEG